MDPNQKLGNKPLLWSCCLRSRDAEGRPLRWIALMGTGAVTSGSPLAAPDLSTQTLCRNTNRQRHWFLQHFNKATQWITGESNLINSHPELQILNHSVLFSTKEHHLTLETWTFSAIEWERNDAYYIDTECLIFSFPPRGKDTAATTISNYPIAYKESLSIKQTEPSKDIFLNKHKK